MLQSRFQHCSELLGRQNALHRLQCFSADVSSGKRFPPAASPVLGRISAGLTIWRRLLPDWSSGKPHSSGRIAPDELCQARSLPAGFPQAKVSSACCSETLDFDWRRSDVPALTDKPFREGPASWPSLPENLVPGNGTILGFCS